MTCCRVTVLKFRHLTDFHRVEFITKLDLNWFWMITPQWEWHYHPKWNKTESDLARYWTFNMLQWSIVPWSNIDFKRILVSVSTVKYVFIFFYLPLLYKHWRSQIEVIIHMIQPAAIYYACCYILCHNIVLLL